MYERFTDRAKKVLDLAVKEAKRLKHPYVGTEHILLGLVKDGTGVASNVLKNLDVDRRTIRVEVEKIISSGPEKIATDKLPQTPRAKKVIGFAMEESRNLNHNYIGTEHLLLGLFREYEGIAAQVLFQLGLNGNNVRAEILKTLGTAMAASEPSGRITMLPSQPGIGRRFGRWVRGWFARPGSPG